MVDPTLQIHGIGREHWHVLRLLQDGGGHAMGEIAESVDLPGATATRVVDRLVADMLAYRRHDPLDRRRVLVHLAEPGREMLETIEDALRDHTDLALATLDPDERRTLLECLGRLARQRSPRTGVSGSG